MKKNSINPDKAKITFSLLIILITSVLVLSLLRKVLHTTLTSSKQQYIENCQNITTCYAFAINDNLEKYINLLGCYYIPEQFINQTDEAIGETIKGLISFTEKAASDFSDVFYVTKEGNTFSQSGFSFPVNDREYYTAIFRDKYDLFINPTVRSKIDGTPIMVLAKAIKDETGEPTGILCASIPLSTFSSILTNSELSNVGDIVLIDDQGRFIIHQEEEWLFQKFDPLKYGIKNRSTEDVINSDNTCLKTVDVHGTPIQLFCSKIGNTGWTLCLKVYQTIEDKIVKDYRRQIILVIVIVLTALIFLITLEYIILNYFQRHQLLATVYDPLTGLWTRQHFELEATKLLRRFPRNKFMLIDCDIRGFKFVNQNYGELSANKMLICYSKILNKHITKNHGIIGRGFADRFYVLFKVSSVHKAMNLFKQTLPEINNEIKDFELPFFPKFGISFLMPDKRNRSVSIQSLIGQASFAKNTIKDNMVVQYSLYNSKLIKKINEEQYIERHMEQSLQNGEFFVMYQPKINLQTDKLVGAEALVRWKSPELGMLSPDQFIPLFERNGFITKLDFYVYDQVFKFMEELMAEGKPLVPISVNMSRNHSKPERFIHDFLEVFKKYSIPSNMVQIEIIERSFMDSSTLKDITTNLHKEGFTVAMDDFGSGESSLNMLTKIPIDVLKFDRDFLQSSTNESGQIDSKAAGFIEILIELSKQLNKETVFEGVETQEQRDFLKNIQCDQAQGFFYSRPLIQEDFIKFMEMHI